MDIKKRLADRAKQLKTDIPAVFLALKKRETPILAKVLAAIVVVYALSPIDLIPDFIPVLGFLDDIIILPALIALTVKMIPSEVFAACRHDAEGLWQGGRPKKWYYALPFVLVWGLILFLVIKAVFL